MTLYIGWRNHIVPNVGDIEIAGKVVNVPGKELVKKTGGVKNDNPL